MSSVEVRIHENGKDCSHHRSGCGSAELDQLAAENQARREAIEEQAAIERAEQERRAALIAAEVARQNAEKRRKANEQAAMFEQFQAMLQAKGIEPVMEKPSVSVQASR